MPNALADEVPVTPGRLFLYGLVTFLALVGTLHIAGSALGDPPMPVFRRLVETRADLMPLRYRMLTQSIPDAPAPRQGWQALRSTRQILRAINPAIHAWLINLHGQDKIRYAKGPGYFSSDVLASFNHVDGGNLTIGPGFWRLQEGDKAAIIAHEFRHARQNVFKLAGVTLTEMSAGRLWDLLQGRLAYFTSLAEDEAHLYQIAAYEALDMPPPHQVTDYFKARGNMYPMLWSRTPACIQQGVAGR